MQVTRTFDFIRVMCVQYWPAAKNREEVYGGVGVTVETEEQLANFMIRYSIPDDDTGESITDLIFLILTCFKQVVSNPPPAPGQNHPAAEGRGGAEGDPVPLHRVALPL